MQMPEGEPHPSTLPGFRGRRDPERSVTRSRSGRKKKRVEFEDVQPQDIPNPTEDNFPRRCITQLPDGVSHIYYTGKELTPYKEWERQHCTFEDVLDRRNPREDDITIARAFILFMMGHLWFQTANDTVPLGYLAAVNDLDLAAQYDWGSAILASLYHGLDTAVTTGGAITEFVQLLSVTGEVRIPLDPLLSMSPHISPATLHEMRQAGFVDCEQFMSARDAQRIQEVEEELVIARRQIESIDHQLYAHDLQLRRGHDVRVVPLPPGGGTRMRQRGSGPRTRGGSTSRRGRGTRDDSE
ncbi:hypothetical protein GIB67_007419 [Kingdonia uniflora]|uniref:Aminotransferase-like plant mobile domain-containing protein n=1 Tax=Kingdonia uniflora TaxID=39325 RepID=A0A7J7MLS8_9MAGN|nr:hypothetical protein GIB67_007419 [Kingdonia uniflora]